MPGNNDEIQHLEERLREIEAERRSILGRLEKLHAEKRTDAPLLGTPVGTLVPTSADEKIELFHKLFCCRESVFPRFWKNQRKGTKGYSPACRNEWVKGVCNKPKVKCAICSNRDFLPLDKNAIRKHLQGQHIIGTYAIRENDTCTFLACDFDEGDWQQDVLAYQIAAENLGIHVGIERSRSGNGAHAWIFFSDPVPASLARMLGTLILARASETRCVMGLKSYDRFFPNQDTLPKGGFGNLIALPLQLESRKQGNSEFVGGNFVPFKDQWKFLSSVRRLSASELQTLIRQLLPRVDLQSGRFDSAQVSLIDETILETAQSALASAELPAVIELQMGSQLTIPIAGLPSSLIARLKKCATFPNPKFYELQRMRMSTWPHPRFIFSGEFREDSIVLPRGLLEKIRKILSKAGIMASVVDKRPRKRRFSVTFEGELSTDQNQAVSEIVRHDMGVLVAPPGTGKTVMGCSLIAHFRTPTLVLVHRQPLVQQWKKHLQTFLGLNRKEIGVISGSAKRHSGKVDLAMLQTLARSQDLEALSRAYGQVIIDECHHVPAASFESVLKEFSVRRVYGLTATPYRKDKLEKILFQQCGPIRFEMGHPAGSQFEKSVVVHETSFTLPEGVGNNPPYHILIDSITRDLDRTDMIINDAAGAISCGRFPLVIADRKEMLERLETGIAETINSVEKECTLVRMDGGLPTKKRRSALETIQRCLEEEIPVCLLATASFIGEGFDLPELDTLILASPLSFKGRLIQYVGRLHRFVEGKKSVLVHDYLDSYSAVAIKMYRNRLKAYQEMGYRVNFVRAVDDGTLQVQ